MVVMGPFPSKREAIDKLIREREKMCENLLIENQITEDKKREMQECLSDTGIFWSCNGYGNIFSVKEWRDGGSWKVNIVWEK